MSAAEQVSPVEYVNVLKTKSSDYDISNFTLQNVNVSVANAIRRTILSDIPTVVFKGFPYDEEQVLIYKNNTRINNEILKQRLMCIPIHITDDSIDVRKYSVALHVKNDTQQIKNVTTKDFMVIDNETGNEISDEERDNIFPANPLTGDHILFTRLLPKYNDQVPCEEIHLKAQLFYGTAKEDGAYNVACSCSYINTPNTIDQNSAWMEKEEELKSSGMSKEDIEFEKKNWFLHDAQRIYLQNSFDFVIESVGVFTNNSLVKKACEIMKEQFTVLKGKIESQDVSVKSPFDESTFDIRLDGIDYTLGKVLEYYMFRSYFEETQTCNYVGFKKPHPHDDYSVLRVSFTEQKESNQSQLMGMLIDSCNKSIDIFEQIQNYF